MTCTFFGHRNTPKEIEPYLRTALIDLIENKNVARFYIGNQGAMDSIARQTLKALKEIYPQIKYSVVLAYMPKEKEKEYGDFSDTIYPDGLENTPPKFAIYKRNEWMLKQSDFVITYVNRTIGGAAQFKELAKKKGKIVIELSNIPQML